MWNTKHLLTVAPCGVEVTQINNTRSGGFLGGVALCLAVELESAGFKANLQLLFTLREIGLRLAITIFMVGALGCVIFGLVTKLHRFHARLVALGVMVGLIMSSTLHLEQMDLTQNLDRPYVRWAAWIALAVDIMVAMAAILGVFVLLQNKGFWRTIKAWFTSD
jgi:hypothetical protein